MTQKTLLLGRDGSPLAPLIKTYLLYSLLRVAWLMVNSASPGVYPLVGFIPLPWGWFDSYLVQFWGLDMLLCGFQIHTLVRLAALKLGLASNYARDRAAMKPRHRSWLPTALLFCGITILTCCAVDWFISMAQYGWFPFAYMLTGGLAVQIGLGMCVLGFLFGGRYVARASGEVSASFGVTKLADDHWLTQRVHGLAERLNLPKPVVGTTDVMNAFAMGANAKTATIVIGKPLLSYEKDELDAIIGHELGHVLHDDVARMQFAEGFQRMLVKVVNVVTIFGAILAAQSSTGGRRDAQRNFQLALGSGSLVRHTLFFASELVAKGISRNREYHADAVGAYVTSPDAMARALKRVHGVAEPTTAPERHYGYLMFRGSGFGNLFATHPTLNARLKALNAQEVSQAAAKLAQERALSRALDGSEALGISGPMEEESPSPALLWLQASYAATTSWLRTLFATLRRHITVRRLGIAAAVAAVIILVAPALTSFYGLDRRFQLVRSSIAAAATDSWAWVSTEASAVFPDEDAERIRELEARENRLLAERDTARREAASLRTLLASSSGNGNSAWEMSPEGGTSSQIVARTDTPASPQLAVLQTELAKAQREANDLLRKLNAVNNDRTKMATQIAQLQQRLLPATAPTDGVNQQLAADTQRLQRELEELKRTIATKDAQILDLRRETDSLTRTLASWSQERTATATQIRDLQQELAIAAKEKAAPATWLAAAASQSGSVEVAVNQKSSAEARRAAVSLCAQKGGKGCYPLEAYSAGCVAVARPHGVKIRPGNFWLGNDRSSIEAQGNAIEQCFNANGGRYRCDTAFVRCSN